MNWDIVIGIGLVVALFVSITAGITYYQVKSINVSPKGHCVLVPE